MQVDCGLVVEIAPPAAMGAAAHLLYLLKCLTWQRCERVGNQAFERSSLLDILVRGAANFGKESIMVASVHFRVSDQKCLTRLMKHGCFPLFVSR
jgi:hypothetical protein